MKEELEEFKKDVIEEWEQENSPGKGYRKPNK
jgi:hypothetical protein